MDVYTLERWSVVVQQVDRQNVCNSSGNWWPICFSEYSSRMVCILVRSHQMCLCVRERARKCIDRVNAKKRNISLNVVKTHTSTHARTNEKKKHKHLKMIRTTNSWHIIGVAIIEIKAKMQPSFCCLFARNNVFKRNEKKNNWRSRVKKNRIWMGNQPVCIVTVVFLGIRFHGTKCNCCYSPRTNLQTKNWFFTQVLKIRYLNSIILFVRVYVFHCIDAELLGDTIHKVINQWFESFMKKFFFFVIDCHTCIFLLHSSE